jgi:hypothetical protein
MRTNWLCRKRACKTVFIENGFVETVAFSVAFRLRTQAMIDAYWSGVFLSGRLYFRFVRVLGVPP